MVKQQDNPDNKPLSKNKKPGRNSTNNAAFSPPGWYDGGVFHPLGQGLPPLHSPQRYATQVPVEGLDDTYANFPSMDPRGWTYGGQWKPNTPETAMGFLQEGSRRDSNAFRQGSYDREKARLQALLDLAFGDK